MIKTLSSVGIIFGWFFASFFLLIFTLLLLNQTTHTKKLDVLMQSISADIKPSFSLYAPSRPATFDLISAITAGDARGVLLDRFLTRQRSPMAGMGDIFVKEADKYGLDYRLVPAIAQKESGLGRILPKHSYNAWGWAIFTGKNSGAVFDSWEHGVEIVARGIKENYINKGLNTPEAIMSKYTPNSDGSWANDVLFTMQQIETGG